MKNVYLLITVLAIACSVNAQVTLTKAFNEPVLGNTITKQLYDSVGIVPKNTGANQIWDFSGFMIKSTTETSNYITPSSAPNGASYTGVTFVESYGSGNYLYMKVTASRYELVGLQNPNFKLNLSSNTATEFMWPVTMGYSLNDAFSGTANANNMNGSVSGNANTLGCGTGTLILPGGVSYTGVLQVKMSLTAHASFLFGLTTVDLKLVQYMYYDVANKFPLLTVMYTDVSGAYTSKSADVKVNSAIVGINDLTNEVNFNMFPNPANDNVQIKLQNATQAHCKIDIMNALGQIVQTADLGNDTEILNTISISHLPSGIYLLKTTLGNIVSNRKLIVE